MDIWMATNAFLRHIDGTDDNLTSWRDADRYWFSESLADTYPAGTLLLFVRRRRQLLYNDLDESIVTKINMYLKGKSAIEGDNVDWNVSICLESIDRSIWNWKERLGADSFTALFIDSFFLLSIYQNLHTKWKHWFLFFCFRQTHTTIYIEREQDGLLS